MSPIETLTGFGSWKSNILMAHLIPVIFLLMPLAGCTNEGAGGPTISSLSTPTEDSANVDSDQAADSADSDGDGEGDPVITMTPTPTGVTAHLTWVHPPDMNVAGYSVYYRKQPLSEPSSEESSSEEPASEESGSEEPSSCSSGESQAVAAPAATITGLEPNTRYLFAIHAFNGNESESLCSNEIAAVTPSAQS
jgi:hypothetical protein